MLTVDPNAIAFNGRNARALLEVCALAYNPPCRSGQPCNQGDIWIEDPFTDAHALVQDRGDCIIVAFRGSKDPQDYIQDGKFEMQTLVWTRWEQDLKVHEGFMEDFGALCGDILHAVRALIQGKAKVAAQHVPVFITGHSLGGALAILCAFEFARQHGKRIPVAGVYTFGQPRVGNAAFADAYNGAGDYPFADCLLDLTYRVVNENDIVPRMPPWIDGYRHCGQNMFMYTGGYGVVVNPSKWQIALSDAMGFWGAFRSLHDVLVNDHHLESYQRRMESI